MEEREAYIALNIMEGIGPVGVRTLVARLGSARAIFSAAPDALQADGVSAGAVKAVLSRRDAVDWRAEEEEAARAGIRIVTQVDDEYPDILRKIHDPPLALYVRGRIESRDRNAVAVVGTRRPTRYGRDCASFFARGLAEAGFTVVSGLAEGIDASAHEAALAAGGRTIAVIGSGMMRLYPPNHAALAERIAGRGAVLSEFPLRREPDRTTFPIRNRIVSGLSLGTLVIEADMKSGALITARMAMEQGRQVFAVPGRIDSPMSRGANDLIRQGAKLVSDIDDIISEFEFLAPGLGLGPGRRADAAPDVSEDERKLLDLLEDGEMDVDRLTRASGLKAGVVGALLIGLEMKKLVRMLPGRVVEKVRSLSANGAQ